MHVPLVEMEGITVMPDVTTYNAASVFVTQMSGNSRTWSLDRDAKRLGTGYYPLRAWSLGRAVARCYASKGLQVQCCNQCLWQRCGACSAWLPGREVTFLCYQMWSPTMLRSVPKMLGLLAGVGGITVLPAAITCNAAISACETCEWVHGGIRLLADVWSIVVLGLLVEI